MLNKTIPIPVLTRVEDAHRSMSPTERWVFYTLAIALALSVLTMASYVHIGTTIRVPEAGGKITEGVVGAPRFINPVLAISQTDKDLSNLVYASLMTLDNNGNLVPELAESYSVSEDATEYTFKLKSGLAFHDGTPLTADDVVFTIEKAMQPGIKSPERANWEGVTVTQNDELSVTFSLSKPYAQFLQNTLLGILPEEHWGELTADEFIFSKLNTAPIGSGPYRFASATDSSSGILSNLTLVRFKDYVRGTPYIKKITMNFYAGNALAEEALSGGSITSLSEVSPHSVNELLGTNSGYAVNTSTLPRIFAVFFNQSHNEILVDESMRKILRDVIDKDLLIAEALGGYAQNISSPILSYVDVADSDKPSVLPIEQAKGGLADAGWEKSDDDGLYYKDDTALAITLTTANSSELKDIATSIANTWQELGVQVKLEVFEPGNLAQSVLRTREYDALLFGEIVGTDPDPYAFWHSSQRNDPGLNIANYASSSVDSLLLQARTTVDNAERKAIYADVATELNDDVPAIFLYAPHFIYLVDDSVLGIKFAPSMEPHDRFNNIHLWHIDTSRVWNFLAK